MAKEYIERETLLHKIRWASSAEEAVMSVRRIPAADVAEVVRCKDCRLRGREECAMFYRCECGEQHTWETDNDFCSWAKRRDRDNA